MALYGDTKSADVEYLIGEFSKANMIEKYNENEIAELSSKFLSYITKYYYNFFTNWSSVGYFKKRDLILEFIENMSQ